MGNCFEKDKTAESLLMNDKKESDYDAMSIVSFEDSVYRGADPATFLGKRFYSRSKPNKDYNSSNKDERPKYFSNMLLVEGYIRLNCRYFIREINQICILYHPYWTQLISFNDADSQWFTNAIENDIDIFQYGYNTLNKYPLTQHIDDKYQIVFVSISTNIHILWKGFLCINIENKQVCQLIRHWNKDVFHLSLSQPLMLNNKRSIYHSPRRLWLKPIKDTLDQIDDDNNKTKDYLIKCQYQFWTDFEFGLWNLFITNQLYDEDGKKMDDHQIWKVIQFLSVINFEDKHCNSHFYAGFSVPQLILNGNDYPKDYFQDIHKRYYETIVSERNFDIFTDCIAKIDLYKKGKRLKCHCYLYVDWGDGYYMGLGNRRVLYRAEFELSKPKDVVINFVCNTVAIQDGGGL